MVSFKPPSIKYLMLIFVIHGGLIALGFELYMPPIYAGSFWPANGFLIALLLTNPHKYWPHILAVTYLANISVYEFIYHVDITPTLIYAFFDSITSFLSAWFVNFFVEKRKQNTINYMVILFLACIIIGPTISALIGGSYSAIFLDPEYIVILQITWGSYSVGSLFTLILFLRLMNHPYIGKPEWSKLKSIEAITLLVLTIVLTEYAFSSFGAGHASLFSMPISLLSLLAWSALRLGLTVVIIQLPIIALILLFNAILGDGPFIIDTLSSGQQIISMQAYLAVIGITSIALAVVVEQNKQSTDHIKEAVSTAEKANRAKSEFLARTSHELRTPLNAILGFSEMMVQAVFGKLGSKKYEEYAEDINASAAHLLDLIEDVQDLAKIEANEYDLNKEVLSPDLLVSDCKPVITQLAQKKGIECSFNIPQNLRNVHVDRRSVERILINILSNAIKYTPDGGKVTLTASEDEKWLIVIISDTGRGIPADKVAVITKPFIRAESDPYKSEEGTGLGLAIVNSLVELHGGTLSIESEVGIGTTISLYFPHE